MLIKAFDNHVYALAAFWDFEIVPVPINDGPYFRVTARLISPSPQGAKAVGGHVLPVYLTRSLTKEEAHAALNAILNSSPGSLDFSA